MFYTDEWGKEAIIQYILFNAEAHEQISNFAKTLENQGVLRRFIDPEKLDELMVTLREKNVLSGHFAWIEFSSEFLLGDFIAEFVHNFADMLIFAEIRKTEEIVPKLRELVNQMYEPQNTGILCSWLINYALKVTNVFFQAIQYYSVTHSDEYYSLVKTMAEAIPTGRKNISYCQVWAFSKSRTFNKVSFDGIPLDDLFEVSYMRIIKDIPKAFGDYTRKQIYEESLYKFKLMLIADVFEKIKDSKKRTSTNISCELRKILEEKPNYVYVNFFVAVFRLSLHIIETEQNRSKNENFAIPALPNNGIGNIPC